MRIAAAADSNFSYWHSATFNNDGTKVLFSDEWGGGGGPKCRATDPKEWGADAIFTIGKDRALSFDGYYKMPAAQTAQALSSLEVKLHDARMSRAHLEEQVMDRYDTFWLSVAPRVRLPDGEPCFSGVPARSPQDVLAAHGLKAGEPQLLDAAADVSVTPFRRS